MSLTDSFQILPALPAEAIAILLPIDRLLDTVRTVVNVQGDMMISVVVDRHTREDPALSS